MTCTQCKARPSIAATDEVHLCAECLAATKPTLIFTDSPCSLESLVDELRGEQWMRVSEHERIVSELKAQWHERLEEALLTAYPDTTTCGVCGASPTNMHGTFLCPTCYQAERS